ncbi:hypothetical protein BSF40_12280 [Pseudomonas sp. ACN5]|nr:hypothetical protein BSF40_12280 [Pseudomonas sp. ACN5]
MRNTNPYEIPLSLNAITSRALNASPSLEVAND